MKKDMEYVYMVYQKQSFSEAAKCLYISQPALSAIVKKVEESLNTQIFDRSTKPISLTRAGEYYISSIERIMAIERDMNAYFDDLNRLEAGTVSIGAGPLLTIYLLSALISGFRDRYPKIHFDMHEASRPEKFEEWLEHGICDFTIGIFPIGGSRCYHIPVHTEHLILVVPKNNPINNTLKDYQLTYEQICRKIHRSDAFPAVSLSHFANEKFISLHETGDLYKRCELMFQNASISPEITTRANQSITAYFMCSCGVGIAFVQDNITDFVINTNNIIFYKIDDPLSQRTLMLHYRKDKHLSIPASAFLEYMTERFSHA